MPNAMCPSFGIDPKKSVNWHFIFICFLLSYSGFPQIILATVTDTLLFLCLLVRPGCREYEWSSGLQLSIYQHAGCLPSWCMLGLRGKVGKPKSCHGGRWALPSGTEMPTGTDGTVLDWWGRTWHVWRERDFDLCVPAMTNWIKPPVDMRGSASVRLTSEEDWHSGWSRQRVGGMRVAENRCVCHCNPAVIQKQSKHYNSKWT